MGIGTGCLPINLRRIPLPCVGGESSGSTAPPLGRGGVANVCALFLAAVCTSSGGGDRLSLPTGSGSVGSKCKATGSDGRLQCSSPLTSPASTAATSAAGGSSNPPAENASCQPSSSCKQSSKSSSASSMTLAFLNNPPAGCLGPLNHMITGTTCTMQREHVKMSKKTNKPYCQPYMNKHRATGSRANNCLSQPAGGQRFNKQTHTDTVMLDIVANSTWMHN